MNTATPTRHSHSGICPAASGCTLTELIQRHAAPVWVVVTADLKTTEHLAEDLQLFHRASENPATHQVLAFPESMPDSRDMREAFNASSDRLTALSQLRARRHLEQAPDSLIVVTHCFSLFLL
jgi:transcription-repair coupling factor (superfamily II helicase)